MPAKGGLPVDVIGRYRDCKHIRPDELADAGGDVLQGPALEVTPPRTRLAARPRHVAVSPVAGT